ncbi:MAG: thiamine-phosphate kinase [Candidatus Omnitrophica bacterium]|nr:thiamine-phosphate kinase [Candidatus Omnitrophota bacterium]
MKKGQRKITLKTLGEFGLIAKLAQKAFVGRNVIKGIGDDTAVLPFSSKKYLLLTTDMLCEGVHFTRQDDPALIGHKALACSLSDIAAMGGKGQAAVISIGLPKNISANFVEKIYFGINRLAKKFQTSIVGGDTISSPRLMINVALLGEVRKKYLVLRSGAKKGDQIFVTGPLGRSLVTKKHLSFVPRLKEANYLVSHFKPTAMIDISDGLAADLGHILEESHKGAVIDEPSIPMSKGATLKNALSDGEDFELIFTLSKTQAVNFFKQKKLKAFWIGEITAQTKGLYIRNLEGKIRRLIPSGYKHF